MTKNQEMRIVFFIGAIGYGILEISFRGYTHWTMLVTGGFCFLILYIVNERYYYISFWKKCLIGAAVITTAEFIVGCIVNLWLGWNVWDYSNYSLQLWGQICLPFSVLWFFTCIPIYYLSNILHRAAKRSSFQ